MGYIPNCFPMVKNMYKSEKQLSKILSLTILFLLVTGILVPVMSETKGYGSHPEIDAEEATDDIEPFSDDEWLITETVYVNSSRQIDSHITITGEGELIINDSTLTLLIDEYHPWKIEILDGGRLELWNSVITTKLRNDGDVLRPYLKTNISAQNGSEILMEENSEFKFPGWVFIENSDFTMRKSSFESLDEVPDYDGIEEKNNDDCPRFTALNGSSILIEDSEINDYYSFSRDGDDKMVWRTFEDNLETEEGEYVLGPNKTLEIDEWYLDDADFPFGVHDYIDPYNRISALAIEITYSTEDNYTVSSPLNYSVNDEWKEALIIGPQGTEETFSSDIWELDLDSFYRGEENYLKDLSINLTNQEISDNNNKSIIISEINLVSEYNNDIYIRDSEMTVINSHIDVDYNAAQPDPTDDDSITTDETWMQDANLERRAIRLIDSDFRSYGVYPQDEWSPDGDPFLIADENSENRTWYYRWVTVTALDSAGTPLPETNINITLDESLKDLSEALYDNVDERNDLTDNLKAWDYFNRTGKGYYDHENNTFITGEDGQVTLFLISDRVNHPQDWPNTRSVGDYFIEGKHEEVETADGEINLENFPNMNETATFHDYDLIFDEEIPLPDFNITEDDFRILKDGIEVSFVTRGTELELEATVSNTGRKDAVGNIELVFYSYFEDEPESVIVETEDLDGLEANESKTRSVFLDTTEMDLGDYLIGAHVDPYDDYDELNTDNNFADKEITLSDKANLQPFELAADPADTITDGEDISFYAGIENIGGTDAHDVTVSFYYEDGETLIGSDTIEEIPGNDSIRYTELVLWEDYPGPGEYNVTVVVDPDNDIDEVDTTNNELWGTFTILSTAELFIDLRVEPDDLYEDETVDITGTINNTGETISSDIDVYFYLDEGTEYEDLIHSEFVPGIEGGDTVTFDYQWTAEMVSGELSETRTISMIIEPEDEGQIEEPRKDVPIDLMKPAHISLVEDDISFDDELSEIGKMLNISAEVWNSGGAEATVDVSFYDGFPGEDSLIDAEADLEIDPDSHVIVEVEWTPETRGNRDIHVIVEHGDEIIQAVVTKPIFSVDYSEDLIIGGEGFPEYEQISVGRDIGGFVLVQDSGVLEIVGPNAGIELVMNQDNRYNVIVQDQGSLKIENGQLSSDHNFNLNLEDESELVLGDNSVVSDTVNLNARDNSQVSISHTTFHGSMDITSDVFYSEGSEFTSQDVMLNPSYVDMTNSTFEVDLVHFHDTEGSLTWVETGAIQATGDSEIQLYRWVKATALSRTRLTIQGAEVTAENLQTDYTVTGITDSDGVATLRVLTDIITKDGASIRNSYRFSASYVPEGTDDEYEVEFQESLPRYNSQEYIIELDMHLEDLAIPDLSISQEDIYADRDEISINEEVWIFADIENVGETEAEGVDVYFYIDQTDELIGVDNLDSVPTEGYSTASVTWTAEMTDETMATEDIDIRVWIDPDVEPIQDPNLANNEAVTTLTVRSPPITEFDSDIILWRDGTQLTEEDQIVERDDLIINIRLTNIGGSDLVDGTLNISISGDELIKDNVSIESGDVLNYTYEWNVRMRGQQNIQVWYNSSAIDPASSSYTNRTINIANMDLEFTGVSLLETEPGADKVIQGTLVRGDGTGISGIDIHAYLIDEDGQIAQDATITSGDGGDFIMEIPEPAREGRYSLSLEADYPDAERIPTGQSIEVGEPVETGIPLWMIIAVIGAIAGGSVGGIFAYMKIKGPGEWVECGNCGTTIPSDVQECPECGVEFETEKVKCSECGEWIPYDSDECPNCGSQFIKTGEEVQDYEETMKQQYENYVEKYKSKAKVELGEEFTEEEFMDWWQEQPSYITFDEWLEREEARRKEGGIECPECGALNSVDDAICQKCGSTLITLDEDMDEEDIDVDLEETEASLDLEVETDEEFDEDLSDEPDDEFEEEDPEEEEPEEEESQDKQKKKVVAKKVKKKPKKVVKKKVKKKAKKKEDE